MNKYLLVILVSSGFLTLSKTAYSQEADSLEGPKKIFTQEELIASENIETFEDPFPNHSPAKASIYSAVLPGLGQAYNKQYWKIPLIYSGAIAIGYFINFNHQQYVNFRRELFALIDIDPTTNPTTDVSEAVLRRGTDEWRRNRDLLYFLAGVVYMLNIVDAHVSAHLKSFDIDESISMKIEPSIDQLAMVGAPATPYPGLSIKFVFR